MGSGIPVLTVFLVIVSMHSVNFHIRVKGLRRGLSGVDSVGIHYHFPNISGCVIVFELFP
jgi:hypothetical protein